MRTIQPAGRNAHGWGENGLLVALPHADRERLLRRCDIALFETKEVVYRARSPISHVHFPLRGMMSLVRSLNGHTVELAAIGREGMVGTPLVLNVATSPSAVVCQISGACLRTTARHFMDCLAGDAALRSLVQRYTQALTEQISLSVLCNRMHPVEKRLCRWLLMVQDKIGSDELPLTQEAIAQMLGVRRPTMTEVASMLQSDGIISYSRGKITILKRHALEAKSCACYAAALGEHIHPMVHAGARPAVTTKG